MAEGVTLNAASGTFSAAADAIGGDNYQRVKLTHGVDGTNDGDVAKTNPLPVAHYAVTAGGTSGYHKVAAGSNNAAFIKASAGQVYGIHGFGLAAYPVYVKLYDKATAPTPGTDTPVRTIGLQSGVRADDVIFNGLVFTTGIAIAIVKGIADSDNTPVVASDCVIEVDWK